MVAKTIGNQSVPLRARLINVTDEIRVSSTYPSGARNPQNANGEICSALPAIAATLPPAIPITASGGA